MNKEPTQAEAKRVEQAAEEHVKVVDEKGREHNVFDFGTPTPIQ